MEENSEILNRLERLESKEDIRDLVSKYAEACDQQDLESLEKLFTEDAEFDSPSGMLKSKGRQNIIDMYLEVFKSRGPSFHWTHDVRVQMHSEKKDIANGTIRSLIFFSGISALAFLTTGPFQNSSVDKPSILDMAFSLISILTGVYFALNAPIIINRIVLLDELTQLDIIFGTVVLLLTLEITRRTTGLGLTLIVVLFILVRPSL